MSLHLPSTKRFQNSPYPLVHHDFPSKKPPMFGWINHINHHKHPYSHDMSMICPWIVQHLSLICPLNPIVQPPTGWFQSQDIIGSNRLLEPIEQVGSGAVGIWLGFQHDILVDKRDMYLCIYIYIYDHMYIYICIYIYICYMCILYTYMQNHKNMYETSLDFALTSD